MYAAHLLLPVLSLCAFLNSSFSVHLKMFRYLPVDVAKSCGWIELVPLLSINSELTVPDFPASLCPSLVLMNIIKLARSLLNLQFDALSFDLKIT